MDISQSIIAKTRKIDNTPTKEATDNSKYVIDKIIKPLQKNYGLTNVLITSFYRSKVLNRFIGSKDTSQHIKGQAVDLMVYGIKVDEVFEWIKHNLKYDQLIHEGTWIHISYKKSGNRQQVIR